MKLSLTPLTFRQVLPSACGILILGAVLSLFQTSWQWFADLGWSVLPYGALLGGLFYLIGYLASCSRWTRTRSMTELLETLHQLFQNFTWPQIIIISLLAGIGEEWLIRAVLQSFLVESFGPALGILAASLIFGLLHFMTKTYVLLTFLLGSLFGLAFYLTNSLLLVVVAHAVYDIFAFAMIVKFPHVLGVDSSNAKTPIISA